MRCGSWHSCQICPLAYRAAWLKASDSRDFCESSGHRVQRLSFCPDCDHFSYDHLLFHPGCWKQRKPSGRLNQGAWFARSLNAWCQELVSLLLQHCWGQPEAGARRTGHFVDTVVEKGYREPFKKITWIIPITLMLTSPVLQMHFHPWGCHSFPREDMFSGSEVLMDKLQVQRKWELPGSGERVSASHSLLKSNNVQINLTGQVRHMENSAQRG